MEPSRRCLVLCGNGWKRRGGVTLTTLAQHLGDVWPRQMVAQAVGLDDAGQQRESARALRVARAIADAPGNYPMTQGTLGERLLVSGSSGCSSTIQKVFQSSEQKGADLLSFFFTKNILKN